MHVSRDGSLEIQIGTGKQNVKQPETTELDLAELHPSPV